MPSVRMPDGTIIPNVPKGYGKAEVNELYEAYKLRQEAKDSSFLGSMIGNIPESAAKFAGDVVSPILSPIETTKSIGKLIGGTGQKMAREAQEAVDPRLSLPKGDLERYPEAMGEFFEGRYGSVPAIKETLRTDPIGSVADVAGALTLGGTALSKIPLIGKVGKTAQKMGMAIDPINLLKAGARKSVLSPDLPANLYKRAAKFPGNLDVKQGIGTERKLAETAVKHRLKLSEKGVLALEKYDMELGKKVGGLIDKATKEGKAIPKAQLYRKLKEARQSVGGLRLKSKKHLAQVNEEAKNMTELLDKIPGDTVTPKQAQQFKISAQTAAKYAQTKTSLGQGSSLGTEEATKAIASATKEGIEKAVPEVSGLNKELSALKKLKDPFTQAASRVARKDLVGIGAPLKMVAGQQMAGDTGKAIGVLAAMAENQKVNAAFALQTLQDLGIDSLLAPGVKSTLMQQGLLQSGRAEPILEDE